MTRNARTFLLLLMTVAALAVMSSARADHPAVENLLAYPAAETFAVENGGMEAAEIDGQSALRWRINMGQTSLLSMRREHPLFGRLRYYDRLQFEFRIRGQISLFSVATLGLVTGPRQYKVHDWDVALRTTQPGQWHFRELDLARPAWFPWDNPDGFGTDSFFRMEALAIEPETSIELRSLRLIRGLIYLKPDYELPITWPVKSAREDGSAIYTISFQVLNSSARPTEIQAKVASAHSRFAVKLEPGAASVKAGQTASFTLTAEMSKQNAESSEELYSEPLRVAFAPSHAPEANSVWEGRLVRPLSKSVRRQAILGAQDLAMIREKLQAADPEFKSITNYDRVMATANAALGKRFDVLPRGHNHVRNGVPTVGNPPKPLQMGEFMPEVVEPSRGFREVGTHLAGLAWREFLGFSGGLTESLAMAYLLSGDEKYAQKSLELFELYARQYTELDWYCLFDPPWNNGPNILSSSRVSSNSTYGTNWYFKGHCRLLSAIADSPSWTNEQRDRIHRGFVLPYAAEIMKFPGSMNNMTDITNHNTLLLGVVFDDATLVHWATRRDAGIATRLLDIDEDGFSSEGRPLNYHFAAMTEYLPSVLYLARSGLTIEYPKERLLAAIRMPYLRATLSGLIPNSGDCGRYQGAGPNHLADFLSVLFPEETWLLDAGSGSGTDVRLRLHREGRKLEPGAWRKMLETKPRLFPHAGMAILRSGETPEEQIHLTLDYGRNVFHAAHDRNHIALAAFGKMFSHGVGSLYNAGSGGMTRIQDPKLESFCTHGSLGHNVIMVDSQNQLMSIGRLLAWHPGPELQVAASHVDGIQPGVSHTRCVALTQGIVVVFDRVEAAETHTYDFVYHNLGSLKLGEGWSAVAQAEPLAKTANYENIANLQRLTGQGAIRLEWDLTDNVLESEKKFGKPLPTVKLAFWHLPVEGGTVYTGATGMNNPNNQTVPDAAPTVFHRVRGQKVLFTSIFEPHKGGSKVRSVSVGPGGGISIELEGQEFLKLGMEELLRLYRLEERP